MAGLLQPLKWMTHTSYVLTETGSYDRWGDVLGGTTAVTMSCLAFQDAQDDPFGSPISSARYMAWHLLIPNTITATVGQVVGPVTDSSGTQVIPETTIKEIQDWNHWTYGSRFKIMVLDVARGEA